MATSTSARSTSGRASRSSSDPREPCRCRFPDACSSGWPKPGPGFPLWPLARSVLRYGSRAFCPVNARGESHAVEGTHMRRESPDAGPTHEEEREKSRRKEALDVLIEARERL